MLPDKKLVEDKERNEAKRITIINVGMKTAVQGVSGSEEMRVEAIPHLNAWKRELPHEDNSKVISFLGHFKSGKVLILSFIFLNTQYSMEQVNVD